MAGTAALSELAQELRSQIDEALVSRAEALEAGKGWTGIAEDVWHLAAALADVERARLVDAQRAEV